MGVRYCSTKAKGNNNIAGGEELTKCDLGVEKEAILHDCDASAAF